MYTFTSDLLGITLAIRADSTLAALEKFNRLRLDPYLFAADFLPRATVGEFLDGMRELLAEV